MTYIDYDQLDEHVQELNKYIREELEIETYREAMLLLQHAQKHVNPQQKTEEAEEIDYVK